MSQGKSKALSSGAKSFIPQHEIPNPPSDSTGSMVPTGNVTGKDTRTVVAPPCVPVAWGKSPSDAIRAAPVPSAAVISSRQIGSVPHLNKTSGKKPKQSDQQNQQRNSHQQYQRRHTPTEAAHHADAAGYGARVGTKQFNQAGSSNGRGASKTGAHIGVGSTGVGSHPKKHINYHRSANKSDDRQVSPEVYRHDEQIWLRGHTIDEEPCKPGEGSSPAQRSVRRIRIEDLLALRLALLDPSERFPPPSSCSWSSPTREEEIRIIAGTPRFVGDVSSIKKKNKKEIETTPMTDDCKPLEVNEETRWKAKVFEASSQSVESKVEQPFEDESDDTVLKKALLILNKLSLTKFDKLSNDFIQCGIGRNEKCLAGATQLLIKKAQDEPHFSAMYADLCLKLATTPMDIDDCEEIKKGKKFRKILLNECQNEFEQSTATKIELATKGINDEDERRLRAELVKKHYLGHMRFIGELYKGNIISIKVMLHCLRDLLEGEVTLTEKTKITTRKNEENFRGEIDEEKIICFAKLMTTIGSSLEKESGTMKQTGKLDSSNKLDECWKRVEVLASKKGDYPPRVSNRIKFLLQDLIELKRNGWVTRRIEETAKTIAQIHEEAANDVKSLSGITADGIRRQVSASHLDRPLKPSVDADGFVQVPKSSLGRSQSLVNFSHSTVFLPTTLKRSESTNTKRSAVVSNAATASKDTCTSRKTSSVQNEARITEQLDHEVPGQQNQIGQFLHESPEACAIKAKAAFKEYVCTGDLDDIVLTFDEMIRIGTVDSVNRGTSILESIILTVLEMKQEDVNKFISVVIRCYFEKKIEQCCFIAALNYPLDNLQDILIDAPFASRHMVTIVSEFIKSGILLFDFLLSTPENFRSSHRAATFACEILKNLGVTGTESETNLSVIDKLMTDDDRAHYSSAKDLLASK